MGQGPLSGMMFEKPPPISGLAMQQQPLQQQPHSHQHPHLDPHQMPTNQTAYGGYEGREQLVKKEKAHVCPLGPWRIFMAPLFKDFTIQFFGLSSLPGLLTLLLENFLAEMFYKRKTKGQSALLAEDADDNSIASAVTTVAGIMWRWIDSILVR